MSSLFPLLSSRLDPLAAGQSIMQATQQVHNTRALDEQMRTNRVQEEEQNRSAVAREGLAQQGIDLQRQGFQWGQATDRNKAIKDYVSLLREGRYADAEALGQTLQGLGVHLQPAQNQTPNAPSVDEWHAAQSAPQQASSPAQEAPPMPAPAPADDRIDFSASNVDAIREPSQANEMAEAKARVAELGGDTSGFELPPEPQQAEPMTPMAPMGKAPLPPAQSGPGQIEIFIDGKPMGVVDANKMAAEQREFADRGAESFLGLFPDRFKPLMGSVRGARNEAELAQRKKEGLAVAGELFAGERAQAMGAAKMATAGAGASRFAADDARAIIKDEVQKTQAIRVKLDSLTQALRQAASGNSIGERMSALENAKTVLKGAMSDRDMAFIFGATGELDRLMMKLQGWTDSGRLPDTYLKQLTDSTRMLETEAKRALYNRAENVAGNIRSDPDLLAALGEEQVHQFSKIAFSRIAGTPPPKPLRGGGGGGGDVKAAVREQQSTRGVDPFTGRAPTPGAPPPRGAGEPTRPVPGAGGNEELDNRPDFLR